jgi:hypothetical protein
MTRIRLSSSLIKEFAIAPNLLPERFVGHCNELAEQKIAVADNAALPSFEAGSTTKGRYDGKRQIIIE